MTSSESLSSAERETKTARSWRLALGALGVLSFGYMALASPSFGLGTAAVIGAGAFPFLIGLGGVLVSAWVIAEAASGSGEARLPLDPVDRVGWVRMSAFVGSIGLFPLLLTRLGFVVTAVVVTTLVVKLAGSSTWRASAIAGAVMTGTVFVLFSYVLDVPLPPYAL